MGLAPGVVTPMGLAPGVVTPMGLAPGEWPRRAIRETVFDPPGTVSFRT
jgi:hypothetical protein